MTPTTPAAVPAERPSVRTDILGYLHRRGIRRDWLSLARADVHAEIAASAMDCTLRTARTQLARSRRLQIDMDRAGAAERLWRIGTTAPAVCARATGTAVIGIVDLSTPRAVRFAGDFDHRPNAVYAAILDGAAFANPRNVSLSSADDFTAIPPKRDGAASRRIVVDVLMHVNGINPATNVEYLRERVAV